MVTVSAWLRDPCSVLKVLTVTVPAPTEPRIDPDTDEDVESPPPPCSPRQKNNMEYQLVMHVKDVIDRGSLITDLPPKYQPDDGVDLSRKHTFKTWRGKVDGRSRGANGLA